MYTILGIENTITLIVILTAGGCENRNVIKYMNTKHFALFFVIGYLCLIDINNFRHFHVFILYAFVISNLKFN